VEVKAGYKGNGVGRELYKKLEDIIKKEGKVNRIELAVMGATATLFWIGQKFEVKEYLNDPELPEQAILVKFID